MLKTIVILTLGFLMSCITPVFSADVSPLEKMINYERIERNLAPLSHDSKLECATRTHALDIGKNKYCSHYGSDRSSYATRMRRCGYEISVAEEIVACNFIKPQEALTTWLGSPKQKQIILNKQLTKMACSMHLNYWVCLLAK